MIAQREYHKHNEIITFDEIYDTLPGNIWAPAQKKVFAIFKKDLTEEDIFRLGKELKEAVKRKMSKIDIH